MLMSDGTTRPIDEVNLGDEVETTNPETGEHSDQKVTGLPGRWARARTAGVLAARPSQSSRPPLCRALK